MAAVLIFFVFIASVLVFEMVLDLSARYFSGSDFFGPIWSGCGEIAKEWFGGSSWREREELIGF